MALSDFFTDGHTPVNGRVLTKGITEDAVIVQPAGTVLTGIKIKNNSANAVTGGIRFGIATAGVTIHATVAVAANAVVTATPLIGNYQAAADDIFAEAVTSWNSADVDIVLEYTKIDA